MSNLVFRNPDKIQVLPFREWIRSNCAKPREGLVVEDLDLIVRVYGSNFRTDQTGKFMLLELKHTSNKQPNIGASKTRLFWLIDKLLREADPKSERYVGYYLISESDNDWDKATIYVNGLLVSDGSENGKQRLKRFIEMEQVIMSEIDKSGWHPLKYKK